MSNVIDMSGSTTRQQVTEFVETLDTSNIATTYPDTIGLLYNP